MQWTIRLARRADKEFDKLSSEWQDRIETAIDQMKDNPFHGDVIALRGKQWKGRYRRIVGRYRLIFIPYHQQRIVEIVTIRLRTEKTYR